MMKFTSTIYATPRATGVSRIREPCKPRQLEDDVFARMDCERMKREAWSRVNYQNPFTNFLGPAPCQSGSSAEQARKQLLPPYNLMRLSHSLSTCSPRQCGPQHGRGMSQLNGLGFFYGGSWCVQSPPPPSG